MAVLFKFLMVLMYLEELDMFETKTLPQAMYLTKQCHYKGDKITCWLITGSRADR